MLSGIYYTVMAVHYKYFLGLLALIACVRLCPGVCTMGS